MVVKPQVVIAPCLRTCDHGRTCRQCLPCLWGTALPPYLAELGPPCSKSRRTHACTTSSGLCSGSSATSQTLLCAFPVESQSWGPPRPPYCPGPSQSRDRHEGDDAADSSSALSCHPVLLGCPLPLCCVPDAHWLAPGYWLWLASGLHSMCLCLAPRGWGANTVAASLSKRALPVPPGVAPPPCAEQCPSWGWACAVPKGPPYPAPDQKIQCTEQINAGYPFAEQGAKGLRILL